ncbi:MAG: H/ACA ribonucleoprotein complex subunit GAR1 [Candidatus Heimdallarchaeaceae archaeon]
MEKQKIKKLGKASHFSDLGNIVIINPTNLPKIGSHVVNENLEHIGSVIDIFGPVKKPYVSVKIKPQYKENFDLDSLLYIIDKRKPNVRQKKGKKRLYNKSASFRK